VKQDRHSEQQAARRCGVLAHPTALPARLRSGMFRAAPLEWLEFAAEQGHRAWQFFAALGPAPDGTALPTALPSGLALNPWLLDARSLLGWGSWLADDLEGTAASRDRRWDLTLPLRACGLSAVLLRAGAANRPEQLRASKTGATSKAGLAADHCRFHGLLRECHGQQPWWLCPNPGAAMGAPALRQLGSEEADALAFKSAAAMAPATQWQTTPLGRDHAGACGVAH